MNHVHELSVSDKLFGQTTLDLARSETIKKTYMLLGLSIIAAVFGADMGLKSPAITNFLFSGIGFIVVLIGLYAVPAIAMACRHNPVLGIGALLLDGFLSGLILTPLLFLAQGRGIITDALVITGIVFVSVTGYVMTAKKTFSAPRGLMSGMFFGALGLIFLNFFMHSPMISLLISGAVGLLGLFMLISATSDVLNNPEADSPIPGALMLFAGLFNVFYAILRLMLIFSDD